MNTLQNDISNQDFYKSRIVLSVMGVLVSGVGIGMMKFADFGTDPFQTLMTGLDNKCTFITFGTHYVIVNAILLIAVLFLDKSKIGIGTAVNLFLVGYVAEYIQTLLEFVMTNGIVGRGIMMSLGILVLAFASAVYYKADMGVSAYDAFAMMISEKRKWNFRYCRIATDICCVAVGFTLGAAVGIGTLITAFAMGPVVEGMKQLCDRVIKGRRQMV